MTATTVLTQTVQVLIASETTIGTPIDFTEAGTAANVVADAEEMARSMSRGEYDRGNVPGSMTMRTKRVGASVQEVRFTQPCAGSPLASPAPLWHTTLRGLGFVPAQVKTIGTDGFSAADPVPGAIIGDNQTLASATKTARVVHVEADRVYYVTLTGSAFTASDTLYDDAGTQNSADVSSGQTEAVAGVEFRPVTEDASATPGTVTAEYRVGGYRHTVAGARGRGELRLNADEPAMVRGEFRGPFIGDANDAPRTGDMVEPSDLPAINSAPVIKAVPFTLTPAGGSAQVPVVSSCTVTINNTLEDRRTLATDSVASVAAKGHQPTAITGREITVSLDPEHDPGAMHVAALANAETTIEMLARIGSLSGTSGLLVVRCPALQILGDLTDSDRNGIVTDSLSLTASGLDDDEISIAHIAQPA